MDDEKLQKVLARAGLGSRREMETWIEAGRVTVNGQAATLGDRVSERDEIAVDGERLPDWRRQAPMRRVLLYHKPVGEVSTRKDPEGRPTVFDRLPRLRQGRWVSIGRLDLNTDGLLLLTTDGELANALMHPSRQVEREYAVRILGRPSEEDLRKLREGVMLEDGMAHFDEIRHEGGEGANTWYRVILKEGRNREVRRLWEALGLTVSRLIRVRYGPVALPREVPSGRWEYLGEDEVNALLAVAGMPVPEDGQGEEKSEREVRRPGKRVLFRRHRPAQDEPDRRPAPGAARGSARPERALLSLKENRARDKSGHDPASGRRAASKGRLGTGRRGGRS